MVDDVDDDGSGEIEFEEFLNIIKGNSSQGPQKTVSRMTDFFQKLTSGQIKEKGDKSFLNYVHTQKRDKLKDALYSDRGS